MRTTRTKRWALGGMAVGLAVALSAGVAFDRNVMIPGDQVLRERNGPEK